MRVVDRNRKIFTKLFVLVAGVYSRLKSSMSIPHQSLSPVLVMISNCHRFNDRRADSCRIRTFRGYPSFTPSFWRSSRTKK